MLLCGRMHSNRARQKSSIYVGRPTVVGEKLTMFLRVSRWKARLPDTCVSMTVLPERTRVHVPVNDQLYRLRETSCRPTYFGSGDAYVQSDSDDSSNLLPLARMKKRELFDW